MKTWDELKILYVEDDDETRIGLEKFLKRRFGKVFLADTGEKGLETIIKHSPDIVIADILLPKISGLEMIRQARKAGAGCKVLITSTVEESSTILEAVDLNIEGYVVKPLEPDILENKLNSIALSLTVPAPEKVIRIIGSKKEAGEKIRKGIIGIIKDATGKGPRDASVFISAKNIEITLYGTVGKAEKTLLLSRRNTEFIEEFHKRLYRQLQDDFIRLLAAETGNILELTKIEADAFKDKDLLIFE